MGTVRYVSLCKELQKNCKDLPPSLPFRWRGPIFHFPQVDSTPPPPSPPSVCQNVDLYYPPQIPEGKLCAGQKNDLRGRSGKAAFVHCRGLSDQTSCSAYSCSHNIIRRNETFRSNMPLNWASASTSCVCFQLAILRSCQLNYSLVGVHTIVDGAKFS